MALLFWEGFDTYGSLAAFKAARPEVITNWNTRFGWDNQFNTSGGRFNGCRFTGDNSVWGPGLIQISALGFNPTELYTGRAWYFPNGYADGDGFLQIYGNAFTSGQGDVYLTCGAGAIIVYNSSGTIIAQSVAGVIKTAVWQWIEVRIKMSTDNATADGIVEVWVDNQKVISNLACITKRSNSSTGYGGTSFNTYYADGGNSWDDIYITDTTGPAPWNGRIGDCRMASIAPIADSGPNQGVVSTGNTYHWTVVDEIPYTTSDYLTLSANTPDYAEMFQNSSLPSINIINVIATSVVVVASKTDAGNATFKISMRLGSNTYNSNTQYLSTTDGVFRQNWSTNPDTGNHWTLAAQANANVGIYIV